MVEVYVVLHGQKNGLMTITAKPGIVGKIDLPVNLVEFSMAPDRGENFILLRLPRFIATEYHLIRSKEEVLAKLEREIEGEVTRTMTNDGPNQQDLPKSSPQARRLLAPVRTPSAGHVLDSGRAKSVAEQLALASQDL
jgi:hypothetical protein